MIQDADWIVRTGWSVLKLKGADRIDLLHRISTNDLTRLQPGNGIQTVLLTEKARMIDVVTVLQYSDHSLLICSPGAQQTVAQWIRKYVITEDVKMADLTSQTRVVEVVGARADAVVTELLGVEVGTLPMCNYIEADQLLIVRMPSVSELSYWIFDLADKPTQAFTDVVGTLTANADQLHELSATEMDTLRIKKGLGILGKEWTEEYNPLEAGLLHLTSFTKGCYIGQEVVARLDSYNKVKQRIMGLTGTHSVSEGDAIQVEGSTIGKITSVAQRQPDGTTIALGYVRGEHAHPDAVVNVIHDEKKVAMTLHYLPMEV